MSLKIKSGSQRPGRDMIATLNKSQIEDIAKAKMEDLNANDIDAAMNIVRGTARSMGIKTE